MILTELASEGMELSLVRSNLDYYLLIIILLSKVERQILMLIG